MQLKKKFQLGIFTFCLFLSAHLHSHDSTCREALVYYGHFDSVESTRADLFVERSIHEITRFHEGRTDAPHMTAEQIAKHATYRIVPRNQTPINEAKTVFVFIHGNGGGNSGPHSLSGVMTEVQKIGVTAEGTQSKFYVEAPALPGAEAGPNRSNYDNPAKVVDWTIKYLSDLRSQMGPDAKLVVFTRSSGADFGIKATLEALSQNGRNEGLVTEVIAMSPTTTGINPEDKVRLRDAEVGAIDDLNNNGSGLNHSAFGWIMSMLHQSPAWTPADIAGGAQKPKFKFLTGSQDKQVPISEREFDSNLARESNGNLISFDFLGALHDTFASADGYNPYDQAWPIFSNYIRQEYLGIPATDAHISAESFRTAEKIDFGSKVQLSEDIPVTPKTLVEAFEAGYDYKVDDVFVVENAEAARKHYENSPHSKTAVYILTSKDIVNGFRRASGIPGFSAYRKGARIPNFDEHSKNGRLKLKTADGVEVLKPETFLANEILNAGEIAKYAEEGRLVERQFQHGKAFYLHVYPSNVETYRTWTKLKGPEQKAFGFEASKQEKVEDRQPQAKEGALINFARSCPRGDILVLPAGWHADSATPEQIASNATPLPPQRFDPIYFPRFVELVNAAEKKKLYIENSKGNIEYISPDAIREHVAQGLASRKRSEDLVKQVISSEQNAETAGNDPTGNVLLIENGEARALNATQLADFMSRPESSTLTFSSNSTSPASLRFHAWSQPTRKTTVSAESVKNSAEYQQALGNNTFNTQKDQAFWSLMITAKNELLDNGLPVYDVHSWLLPQALYHQKNAHSIEIKDGLGNVVAGAILLNRGNRWSIDALVDVTKLGDPLKLGGAAKRKVTNCENNPALEKAFAQALKFAFDSGAKHVEIDRVRSQVERNFSNITSISENTP